MIYFIYKVGIKMKKIIKLTLLLVVVVAFCTACEGDVTRELRHDGFNVGGDIICDAFFSETPEQIRYLTSDRIITTAGRIYELSLGQVYSNGSHCKPADTSLKVVAMMDDKIFKADDGNLYSLVSENGTNAYTQVTTSNNSYAIYELLLKPDNVVKVNTADNSNGVYYVLRNDGTVNAITR